MQKITSMNFFMLFTTLAMFACLGFLYKMQHAIHREPYCMIIEADAERDVIADNAVWSLYFERVGEKQSELNKMLSEEKPKVLKFLADNGIPEDEIELYNYVREDYLNSMNHSSNSNNVRYRVGYCVHVKTDKLKQVMDLKNNLSELYDAGICIVKNKLDVRYSKSESIKQELAMEASQKAIEKAKELTKNLKLAIKKVYKIEAPKFSITSPLSESDSEGEYNYYGSINDTEGAASQSVSKRKIRAKINVHLELK